MTEIRVQYFKPFAVLLFLIGPPFMLAFTAISAWISWSLLIDSFPANIGVVHRIAACIIFPVMVIAGAKSAWFCVRYGRETLFTVFHFSEYGIRLDNWRYANLEIGWEDIESVTYDRPLKVVVLKSLKLVSPIAMTNNASHESTEFRAAVSLIKEKCAGRWRQKWL